MDLETKQAFSMLMDRLDKIDRRLDQVDSKLEKIEQRLDQVEVRLDAVEQRLDQVETNLDKTGGRQDLQAQQQCVLLETINTVQHNLQAEINRLRREMEDGFLRLEKRIDVNMADIHKLRAMAQ